MVLGPLPESSVPVFCLIMGHINTHFHCLSFLFQCEIVSPDRKCFFKPFLYLDLGKYQKKEEKVGRVCDGVAGDSGLEKAIQG